MTFSDRRSMLFPFDDHPYRCDVTQATSCQRRVSVKTYHLTRLYLYPSAFYHVTESTRELQKNDLRRARTIRFGPELGTSSREEKRSHKGLYAKAIGNRRIIGDSSCIPRLSQRE